MYYNHKQIDGCSPKLQALLWQQDRIVTTARKSSALEPVLAKIIRMAREEKQGFVCITAFLDMLFFQDNFHEPRKTIPYAELFLKEGREILEESLATEPNPSAFRHNFICCFGVIGNAYMGFYQISTEKMEQFFALYYENVRLYGSEISFYECRLNWEYMCRNKEAAKKTAKHFETLPLGGRCYVCINEAMNKARILLGRLDAALTFSANVIAGDIPSEAWERYETCECANGYWQYTNLFEACLYSGKMDLLDRVLPLLYQEILADEENESLGASDALAYGLYGNFARWENHVKEACEDLGEQGLKSKPYDYMYTCLIWMVYFRLLEKSGKMRIYFPIKRPIPLEADNVGQYNVSEIADYFEQIADDIGRRFEKSREEFAYADRKMSLQTLARDMV